MWLTNKKNKKKHLKVVHIKTFYSDLPDIKIFYTGGKISFLTERMVFKQNDGPQLKLEIDRHDDYVPH